MFALPAQAAKFTASDFLKWKGANQDFYIETSIGMASLIAARNDKAQATCVDDWYYGDEDKANSFILDAMGRFPTYHPRSVILAAIQKQCGSFTYTAP